jgi:hypothetical protein
MINGPVILVRDHEAFWEGEAKFLFLVMKE